jgi:hypothetical protein
LLLEVGGGTFRRTLVRAHAEMWKWIPIKFLLAVAVAAIAVVVYLIHFFQKQGFTNKETTTMSINVLMPTWSMVRNIYSHCILSLLTANVKKIYPIAIV